MQIHYIIKYFTIIVKSSYIKQKSESKRFIIITQKDIIYEKKIYKFFRLKSLNNIEIWK